MDAGPQSLLLEPTSPLFEIQSITYLIIYPFYLSLFKKFLYSICGIDALESTSPGIRLNGCSLWWCVLHM